MMLSTIVEWAKLHAQTRPDKAYCIFWTAGAQSVLTFGDLWSRANDVARTLSECGVQRGELVVICHETAADLYAAFLGAMLLGAPPAIMPHPNAKQSDEVYWASHNELYRRIEPRAFLLSAHFAEAYLANLSIANAPLLDMSKIARTGQEYGAVATSPDEIAFLQHSSGTTSLKKGVMLSHRAVVDHVTTYAAAIGLDADSEIVSWLPLYHDMGLIACFVTPLICGATVTAIDPFEWTARPRLFLEAVQARKGQFAWMPNFGFAHLCNTIRNPEAYNLASLKALINCSEPCRADTHERFSAHFAPAGLRADAMQICYAMAENVFAVSQTQIGVPVRVARLQRDALEAGRVMEAEGDVPACYILSCGRTIESVDIRILDDHQRDLDVDRVGEITVRTPTLFTGYNRRPDLTAATMSDGWYRTNDLGFLRDGELYVTGRRDDVILAYGRNLMAHELEAIVNQVVGVHPGRVVIFGVGSARLGTQEMAVVVEAAADGPAPEALAIAIRERLISSAGVTPRHVDVVAKGALLKTTSGKIGRAANRRAFLSRRGIDSDI